ncbi:MAG: Rieske (2Fe-2S) protein [Gemmatimonadota bacterium]|nr:MAG: Rieske (2Fe-2S) protein [Gemmatimonadota bacterium]
MGPPLLLRGPEHGVNTQHVTAMEIERKILGLGFTELLLGGVILLMITLCVIAVAFYVTPAEHLEVPELQPAIRVAREADFPIGSSRVRNWGEEIILIVRPDSAQYFAVQAVSPADGCILRWDQESSRVYSPCRYMVYDLRGDVVAGLSTQALRRYAVSVREGVIYVSEGVR